MNEKINLQDLISLLSEKSGITKKEAELFLKEYFAIISEGLLQDQLVKVKGLGSFKLILVNERESVDVNKGERVLIPSHYKVGFVPDNQLADAINEPFALFEVTEIKDVEKATELAEVAEVTEIVEVANIPSEKKKKEPGKKNVEKKKVIVAEQSPSSENIVQKPSKVVNKEIVSEEIPVKKLKGETVEENRSLSKEIDRGKSNFQKAKEKRFWKTVFLIALIFVLAVGYLYFERDKADRALSEIYFYANVMRNRENFPLADSLLMGNGINNEIVNLDDENNSTPNEDNSLPHKDNYVMRDTVPRWMTNSPKKNNSSDTQANPPKEERTSGSKANVPIAKDKTSEPTTNVVDRNDKPSKTTTNVDKSSDIAAKAPVKNNKPSNVTDVPIKKVDSVSENTTNYAVKKEDTSVTQESQNVKSLRKRVVKSGERLTLISLEEYGHKSFWVYIYEENKSRIKDPNNISQGLELIIPPAAKYGINKEDSDAIKKANQKATSYKK